MVPYSTRLVAGSLVSQAMVTCVAVMPDVVIVEITGEVVSARVAKVLSSETASFPEASADQTL